MVFKGLSKSGDSKTGVYVLHLFMVLFEDMMSLEILINSKCFLAILETEIIEAYQVLFQATFFTKDLH